MKQLWLIFIGIIFIYGQQITVQETTALTTPEQGAFSHPRVSPDGKVFITKSNYAGLYYIDNNNEIITISDQPGAGYEPEFSADGSTVYYRPYRYEKARKLSSLVKKELKNDTQKILISDRRDFTSPKRLSSGEIVVDSDAQIKTVDGAQKSAPANYNAVAFIEKSRIVIYKDGNKSTLAPLGDGHYIWPSVSPDGTKLLFVKAGKGTFISDLDGNILAELGYANAPQWSPDGKWVVYMNDKDDGHRLLESDIFIVSADGQNRLPVTNTSDILEVYPTWGMDINTIYFASDKGVIYQTTLEME